MTPDTYRILQATAMRVMGGSSGGDYTSWAEDIVQDAAVKLVESGIREETDQIRLGIKIVADLASNFIRNERNRREIEYESGKSINRELDGSREYTLADPLDVMSYEEMRDRLGDLSPTLAATVQAHYIDGVAIDTLAEDEGVSEDRIYKRLQRARDLVRG